MPTKLKMCSVDCGICSACYKQVETKYIMLNLSDIMLGNNSAGEIGLNVMN